MKYCGRKVIEQPTYIFNGHINLDYFPESIVNGNHDHDFKTRKRH